MRRMWVSLPSILVLLLCAGAVGAQTGRIEGNVVRGSGIGVGGVVVVIDQTNDVMLTDSHGHFTFGGIAAGSYDLSFTLGDHVANQAVEVVAGQTANVEVSVDWEFSFAETITVMSASRRAERIVEAPAAVTLVTEQEIAQEAAHGQLPKLLEFTPGAEVTQSGIYDYNVNTRGFNSSLNRRVATLIDGRNPSVPFLGSQEWAAVSFPLDDLSSAELVRGPSAALYGANASSGVLNLVTKQPRYSQGGLFRLTAGELSTLNADVRYAGAIGESTYYKVLGGVRGHGDFALSRRGAAEYAVPCGGGVTRNCLPQEVVPLDPVDDDEVLFAGARVDKHFTGGSIFTVEAGQATIEGPVFQTGIGRVQIVDVERPWARVNYNRDRWNFLVDYTKRDAAEQTALSSGANLTLDTERLHAEVQTNWTFAEDAARVVLGLSHTEEEIDSFDPQQGRQTLMFEPVSADMDALFGQLDWALGSNFRLVLAGRYDDSDLHDSQFSPKGALVYSFNPNHTLRLTYNEAFQVPNYSEFFLQAPGAPPVPLNLAVQAATGLNLEATFCAPFGVTCGFGSVPVLALGNAALEVEEVESYEIGYSGILAGKSYLTIDYYQSKNTNFITDLLSNLGTSLGRVNPAFGPYQPPSAIPAPVAATLVGILAQIPGFPFALMSNNFNGAPIIAAVSYANFGQVDTEGIDLGLNYYIDESWNLSFAYSWFDFEIQEDLPGFDQLLVPNTPEGKGSMGINYLGERWDGSLSARWVDDFRWAVGPFQGDVKSYTTVDLNANYVINDWLKIGATVANLLDDEHYEAFGGDLLGRRALGNVTFHW